jgi:hypothetical protein
MFDRRAGDPKSSLQSDWTGVHGTAQLVVDLGSAQRVDWIAVDLLQEPASGIRIPSKLELYCGNTAGEWPRAPATSAKRPAGGGTASGEFVLGNDSPMGATCRWLRIVLTNPGSWTFLSEIELVGR